MKRSLALSLGSFLALTALFVLSNLAMAGEAPAGFHGLKARTLEGQTVEFSTYAGKAVLVVNVASKCGFTPQYEGLQALHKELAPRGLVVLGFPSNEFGGQEPGSSEDIASFCSKNYGVEFTMFEKGKVKKGADQQPVYQFLTTKHDAPAWNFSKYLVDGTGKVVEFFPSKVTPEQLRERILPLLSSDEG